MGHDIKIELELNQEEYADDDGSQSDKRSSNQSHELQSRPENSNHADMCTPNFEFSIWEPYKDVSKCPPSSYQDFRHLETFEQMEKLLNNQVSKPVLFDLQNSWLKGEQYAHILQNQDRYCKIFGIQKYDQKQHPESIYIDPQGKFRHYLSIFYLQTVFFTSWKDRPSARTLAFLGWAFARSSNGRR